MKPLLVLTIFSFSLLFTTIGFAGKTADEMGDFICFPRTIRLMIFMKLDANSLNQLRLSSKAMWEHINALKTLPKRRCYLLVTNWLSSAIDLYEVERFSTLKWLQALNFPGNTAEVLKACILKNSLTFLVWAHQLQKTIVYQLDLSSNQLWILDEEVNQPYGNFERHIRIYFPTKREHELTLEEQSTIVPQLIRKHFKLTIVCDERPRWMIEKDRQ